MTKYKISDIQLTLNVSRSWISKTKKEFNLNYNKKKEYTEKQFTMFCVIWLSKHLNLQKTEIFKILKMKDAEQIKYITIKLFEKNIIVKKCLDYIQKDK